ncbi:GDP-L-fucose synthase 1 [Carex littledalei]|uniref:GDP-L-fucose synthase 1 n=1 Tax=Carex littledalei TaxID=544730 RepID=A0A833VJI0_9POAL|nr:GDP-L-fucose synthase 1 [Carex littledalei]
MATETRSPRSSATALLSTDPRHRDDSPLPHPFRSGLRHGMCCLASLGFTDIVVKSRVELDLTRQAAVEEFFSSEQPRYVIVVAAKGQSRPYLQPNRNKPILVSFQNWY